MSETQRRKVCIVGFSETTRHLAPFSDPSFEFWGMNTLYEWLPEAKKWDRWFDMHSREFIENWVATQKPNHMAWLAACRIPVYMQTQFPEIPSCIPYPLDAINKHFFADNPTARRFDQKKGEVPENQYLTNTVAQMIALALFEGDVGEIHIYGIDMVKDSEWGYQRPNCEYFIGLARGMGVKVVLPVEGALCKGQWLYGYQEETPKQFWGMRDAIKARFGVLDAEIAKQKRDLDQVFANIHAHEGARQEAMLWLEKLTDVERGASWINHTKDEK